MMTIEWTSIVLAVIGMVSGWFSWWLDRRRHRQEVESLKADNRQKDMDLSKDYVTEWRTYIAEPLQREVGELRQEVAELRDAIQRIGSCPHRAECPVSEQLASPTHLATRQSNRERCSALAACELQHNSHGAEV